MLRLALVVTLALAGEARAQTAVWRMNCGGGAESAPSGPDFVADQAYGSGPAGYVGGDDEDIYATVGGTSNGYADVHASGRVGWSAYRFDVPSGDYVVRLHFAEGEVHGPGLREFDVSIEGALVLANVDVYARVGLHYGCEVALPVTVADGRLDIESSGGESLLSAVEIWTAPAAVSAPAAPTGLEGKAGYHRNILSWDTVHDPAIVGYHVYRGDDRAGPFESLETVWSLPARYLDDGAPTGMAQWYRVAAVDYLGQESAPGGPVVARAKHSDDSTLAVYELTIAPEDWAHLNSVFEEDKSESVPCVLTHAGVDYPGQVRYRGETSLTLPKKSWKVIFPAGGLFQGREQLNLKAHFNDVTMIRQSVGMGAFRDGRHRAPDSWWSHLRVNGVYMGVFQALEKIDEDYLRARDRDDGGSVYKAGENDSVELGLDALNDLGQNFAKETNTGDPYDELIEFIELINLTPDAEFAAAIADVLDLDAYLNYIAVNAFLVDFEAVIRNYHLLHDHEYDRWEVIAWDNDASFSYPYSEIDFGAVPGHWFGYHVLKARVLGVEGLRWRYVEKIRSLMDGPLDTNGFGALEQSIQAEHDAIAVDARADVFKSGWEDDGPFLAGPNSLSNKADIRADELGDQLDGYQPPAPPTSVWINEYMADNVTGATDEFGESDDWIELHNAAASDWLVGGMYLTDDIGNPTQWQIPQGTVIPAGGHLLVWADNDLLQGPLHASFSLSKGGEELGLFAADGLTLVDFHHFGPQLPDVSIGRTEDAGPYFDRLATPTPGAANTDAGNLAPVLTWIQHEPSIASSLSEVRVSCTATDTDGVASVELVWGPAGGTLTTSPMTGIGPSYYEFVLPAQPNGTVLEYYLRATDSLGASVTRPYAAPAEVFEILVLDPQPVGLRINEVLADNESVVQDETGAFEDYIELYNGAAVALNLTGMYLTDDLADPTQWQFPAGTSIDPGETLLVWADGDLADGPLHASFGLSKNGEEIGLFDSDVAGNALIDAFAFGAQEPDVPMGSMPDAGVFRFRLLDPSPGEPNRPAPGTSARYDSLDASLHQPSLQVPSAVVGGQNAVVNVASNAPNALGIGFIAVTSLTFPTDYGELLLLPLLQPTLLFSAGANGNASLSLPIPADPALAGVTAYLQCLVDGPGLTNAVALTVGLP